MPQSSLDGCSYNCIYITPALDWDERKRIANLRKHGIDFVDARHIFQRSTIEVRDARRDYGEDRIGAFGEIGDEVLVVVYVWREGRRRLISARRAGTDERRAYFEAIAS
ncbi:MAG: BrnT family toxin [Alphaproteobacteria bacterium]